eukprot:scaffold1248_cov393-Prasinococcus_capsulatus_cf.AAC.15
MGGYFDTSFQEATSFPVHIWGENSDVKRATVVVLAAETLAAVVEGLHPRITAQTMLAIEHRNVARSASILAVLTVLWGAHAKLPKVRIPCDRVSQVRMSLASVQVKDTSYCQ